MRDWASVIERLERKANDPACSAPERTALLAKATELRERHAIPVTPAPAPAPRPRRTVVVGFTTANFSGSVETTVTATWIWQ